jgi:elongator complex protein 3
MSDFETVCTQLAEEVLAGDLEREDVETRKKELCGEYSLGQMPKNADILSAVAVEKRSELQEVLQRKPTRTASGVSPVAIMTSPKMCPHGKCLYCPGGPASEFSSAQAYTGHEPAAARGKQNEYDPYGQVTLRLEQLRNIGHPIDKVELILMGGTMTARSHDYQTWFVKRALQAMNEYDFSTHPNPSQDESFAETEEGWEYLEDVIAKNETGDIRCIGITFETKPDWCDIEQINRMLRLGGTKVEVGVQTTYERINREMHRGHGRNASVTANKTLRDSGFKVGFHMMPGQPGMSKEMCREDFNRIFTSEDWKPDYLKIYPTLVVGGTRVYDHWKQGEFEPLSSEEAAELVADVKSEIPRYVRLQRVQRDIPADYIEGGVQKSNLRQLAHQKLDERGESCSCIRCREVGQQSQTPESVEMDTLTYESGGGTEHFISVEDFENDILIGFCRLRFPDEPHRSELKTEKTAIVRELHVYGSEATLDSVSEDTDYQHKGVGQQLMKKAETIASDAGYSKLAVISGIGVREYYKNKLGYIQDGPYVSKNL